MQPAQLAARGGRVRCGKCSAVFDAVSCLVGERGASPAEPSPQLGLFDPSRRPAAGSSDLTLDLDLRHIAAATSRPAPPRAPAAPVPAPPAAPRAGRAEPPLPRAPLRAEPDEMPEFLEEDDSPHAHSFVWAPLALLALLLLAGQLALYFRDDIAASLPGARSPLAAACAFVGCSLRLPHRSDLMSIESSDLQGEPGNADVIVLNAVMRNRATVTQEYPDLELTLTDANDQVVVRRVLTPEQYLGSARAKDLVESGIAPGGEVSLRVRFDASRVRATGFRLFLFFP